MYTYSASTVRMAKQYRAQEFSDAKGRGRAVKPKRLRRTRPAPPSVVTSRWWVVTDAFRTGLGSAR